MKLGQKALEDLREEIDGLLKKNSELVIAGAVGLEATELLAKREYEYLRGYFSEGFLWEASRCVQEYGVSTEDISWNVSFLTENTDSFYRLGEGGVLAGIWKMAEASQVGLRIDLRKIPIRQETIEICERFDLNPYKIVSGGSLLLGCQDGAELVQAFHKEGVPAEVIGRVHEGNDRLLYSGEITRYLDRPAPDELLEMDWGAMELGNRWIFE